jgi:TPR repeat protein
MFFSQQNLVMAERWLRKAADQGFVEAQSILADLLRLTGGLP